MEVSAIILYNNNPLAMIRGYKSNDRLHVATHFQFDGDNYDELLKEVFYKLNHEETTPKYIRSMSVGDIVIFVNMDKYVRNVVGYACSTFGWDKLDNPVYLAMLNTEGVR